VFRELPAPEPGPGEVRVRLEGCGVCGSNVPVWEGRPWFEYPLEPGAPGHEGWGRVDALGPGVTEWQVGDRVACLTHHAFAECDVALSSELVRVPDLLAGQPFPGEPLACTMNVFRRSGVRRGQSVAIVGIGFLGALLVQLCRAAGADVVAISRRPFALDVARCSGASQAIPFRETNETIAAARETASADGFDCVIEAVGTQAALDVASELVRVRGRLVIAGYHQDGSRQVNMQSWNWRGLDVINAHERDPQVYRDGMAAAVDAMAAGRLDPAPLLTHEFPLDDIAAALEAARTRPDGFLKALIRMDR
jgi:2-desacetyl-2-hydroxyethyl bacteriochlorophyllide A dehydrogenase